MNVKKMTKEELDLLSYNDIAYYLLKRTKGVKTTAEIFKEIQKLLDLNDAEYIDRIGDFYTTLTTDKRFYSVGKGIWDLKERNIVKVIIEDDEDDIDDEELLEDEESEGEGESVVDTEIDPEDDTDDDDLEEFGIAEEDVVEDDHYEDN